MSFFYKTFREKLAMINGNKKEEEKMATDIEFINYVLEQIKGDWETRCQKMFGEYMIYINEKPVLIVCDNTVYVKKEECIHSYMINAAKGYPYKGAKEHYILDIDDEELSRTVISELEKITPVRRKKNKK